MGKCLYSLSSGPIMNPLPSCPTSFFASLSQESPSPSIISRHSSSHTGMLSCLRKLPPIRQRRGVYHPAKGESRGRAECTVQRGPGSGSPESLCSAFLRYCLFLAASLVSARCLPTATGTPCSVSSPGKELSPPPAGRKNVPSVHGHNSGLTSLPGHVTVTRGMPGAD